MDFRTRVTIENQPNMSTITGPTLNPREKVLPHHVEEKITIVKVGKNQKNVEKGFKKLESEQKKAVKIDRDTRWYTKFIIKSSPTMCSIV